MRWYEEQRMNWIRESVQVFGFINRCHLVRKFGISKPQASTDLQTFQRLHPRLIRYDQSAKRYVIARAADG